MKRNLNLIKELIIEKWETYYSKESGNSYNGNYWGATTDNDWDDLEFSDPSEWPGSDFC